MNTPVKEFLQLCAAERWVGAPPRRSAWVVGILLSIFCLFSSSELVGAEGGKTGKQIQAEFKKMGNRKTRILVSAQKVYKPFNLDVYLKRYVTPFARELAKTNNDGIAINQGDGTKIRMLPVAAAWFELKTDAPEADAGLAYYELGGVSGAGFVMRAKGGKYLSITRSNVLNVISRDGRMGVEMLGVFLAFDRMEFDLPPDYKR